MMLQQVTWQQFLVAALVLGLVWYAGVILIFYRRELKAFLKKPGGDVKQVEPLPHRWEKGVREVPAHKDEDVMGKAKPVGGMESLEVGELSFLGSGKDEQIGLVPDVLAEIRAVFRELADSDGNKKDFFALMEIVRLNYPRIASNPNIGGINAFIADHAPFHLSAEELENLWD